MEDITYSSLIYQKTGHCIAVEIARCPAHKAAAAQLAVELEDLCDQISWDEEGRVVVLAFEGVMHERSWLDPGQYGEGERPPSLVKPIARLKQPVIAAIKGDAIGLGLELALACDIRIAAEGARLGLAQIGEGFLPSDGGTQRLPRLIGYSRAMAMILTGEPIAASEAYRIGLIQRMVASSDLMKAAMDLARDMAIKSPLSLSYAKEALYRGVDLTLDQGLQMEGDLYLLLCTSLDRVEGIRAFKEKRRPKFEGT